MINYHDVVLMYSIHHKIFFLRPLRIIMSNYVLVYRLCNDQDRIWRNQLGTFRAVEGGDSGALLSSPYFH